MSKMYTNKYFIFTILYTKLMHYMYKDHTVKNKQKIHVINILLI